MDITVQISEAEEKALLTDMVSIEVWFNNVVHQKARQCIDAVCQQALSEDGETILTKAEKQEVVTALASEGRIISTVKQMPEAIKLQIVRCARVESAAQRQERLRRENGA